MEVDEVLHSAGELGYFQKKVLVVYCLLKIYLGSQLVQNVFVGAVPRASCKGAANLDGCDPGCAEAIPEGDFHSIANEWHLICSEGSAAKSVQVIFMLGVMIGSFLFGQVSDAIGRKPVLLGSTTASVLFAIASAYPTDFATFRLLRFSSAVFLGGLVVAGFVLMSELVGPSKRGLVGTAPAVFFAFGICCLSGAAYLTKNWRDVSFWMGMLGAAILPAAYLVICESPRWLLRSGKIEACTDLLKRIAVQNGCSFTSISLKPPESHVEAARSRHAVVDLFHHPRLKRLTLMLLYAWFVNCSVYFGLTMAAGSIGTNMYIDVALSGLVEIPSSLLCLKLMNHPSLGRSQTLYWSMLLSGCACTVAYFLPAGVPTIAGTLMTLAAKVFISISFAVIHVMSSELFPTNVRNTSFGVLSVANRLGGITASLVLHLDDYHSGLHFLAFGVLTISCCLVNGLLPETLNKPLPESAEDLTI